MRQTSRNAEASLSGTLTLVQERRFQLVDTRGVAHHFTLAADASFDPAALHALASGGAAVTVTYRDDGEARSHVAREIIIDHESSP